MTNGLQLTQVKNVGDIVGYHNDGFVKWIGGFGQVEYNNGRVSALSLIFQDLTLDTEGMITLKRKIWFI